MPKAPSHDGEGEGVLLEVADDKEDSCPRESDLTGEVEPGFDFCLLLQNHTRTSSGSKSSSWDISSMAWRFGREFWQKNVSKVDFV